MATRTIGEFCRNIALKLGQYTLLEIVADLRMIFSRPPIAQMLPAEIKLKSKFVNFKL
jgi:hypothetical protein